LGTEVFDPDSSSTGLGTAVVVCFSFFTPYAQKLAVVKKHKAAIITSAEAALANMDIFGNMLLQK